ncbi:MAG: LPS biosynthesis protein WbpP, partial [Nitrososphaeraceae archaeon]
FCYIDNVIQMNILAAMTDNKKAYGEAFNVAVGGQTTLNDLYELINQELGKYVDNFSKKYAIYRDFRVGDIKHSNANISKAQELLGYIPTQTIAQGMSLAIKWYINNR